MCEVCLHNECTYLYMRTDMRMSENVYVPARIYCASTCLSPCVFSFSAVQRLFICSVLVPDDVNVHVSHFISTNKLQQSDSQKTVTVYMGCNYNNNNNFNLYSTSSRNPRSLYRVVHQHNSNIQQYRTRLQQTTQADKRVRSK